MLDRPLRFSRSDDVAAEVCRLARGRHILLLTDYDGTLSELAPTPDRAVVTREVRVELDRLASLPVVTLGVVSGRRLADVSARVGPCAELVAGLHGFEIASPAGAFHHPALPGAERPIRDLDRAAAAALAWCPGLVLENKTYALTCHVRLVPPQHQGRALGEFVTLAQPYLDAGQLRLMPGAKAFEALPAADWNKGRAVDWIRSAIAARETSPVLVVYLGDDRTDEDAFAVVHDEGVAIGIGERPHDHLIHWRLAGPASVGRLFGKLRSLLKS